jgi:hypothetical protein
MSVIEPKAAIGGRNRPNSYEIVDARRKFTLMARAVIAC